MRGAIVASMLVALPAVGQLAGGSNFPAGPDNFQQKSPGQTITASEFNKVLGALNAIENYLLTTGQPVQIACTNVTLLPGQRRCDVAVTWPVAISGTYGVVATAEENAPQPRVVLENVVTRTSTYASMCVWNRDAVSARTARVCAMAK